MYFVPGTFSDWLLLHPPARFAASEAWPADRQRLLESELLTIQQEDFDIQAPTVETIIMATKTVEQEKYDVLEIIGKKFSSRASQCPLTDRADR